MSEQSFARIVEGRVFEVVPFDPAGRFPEDWTWAPCPADTQQGATYSAKTGKFINPTAPPASEPAPAPEPVYRTLVSPIEYFGLFTPSEEALTRIVAGESVTAAALKAADEAEHARLMGVAALAVMLRRTDALPAEARIDLTNHQVVQGLGLMVAMGTLAPERPAEVAKGVAESSA